MLIAVRDSPKYHASRHLLQQMGLDPLHVAAVYHTEQPHRFPVWIHKLHPTQRVKAGEWGCAVAHCDAWERVIKLQEAHIIFEDDIAITIEAWECKHLIEDTVARHADKDIVFLGYSDRFLTTHAYRVTPAGAHKLLKGVDVIHRMVPTPVDHHIRRLCQAGELTYAHAPSLPNTHSTEFEGVVKQIRARDANGARIRFADVSPCPPSSSAT